MIHHEPFLLIDSTANGTLVAGTVTTKHAYLLENHGTTDNGAKVTVTAVTGVTGMYIASYDPDRYGDAFVVINYDTVGSSSLILDKTITLPFKSTVDNIASGTISNGTDGGTLLGIYFDPVVVYGSIPNYGAPTTGVIHIMETWVVDGDDVETDEWYRYELGASAPGVAPRIFLHGYSYTAPVTGGRWNIPNSLTLSGLNSALNVPSQAGTIVDASDPAFTF